MQVIKACAVGKGASNVTTSDTIGIKVGPSFAESIEVATFSTGTTNIMTALYNNLYGYPLTQANRSIMYLAPSATSTGGAFLLYLSDEAARYESLWFRRNGVELPTTILTRSESSVLEQEGRMRTGAEMRSIVQRSFQHGSDGAINLIGSIFD